MRTRPESKLAELTRLRDALLEEMRTLDPDGIPYRDRAKLFVAYSARIRALKDAAAERAFLRAFGRNRHGEYL